MNGTLHLSAYDNLPEEDARRWLAILDNNVPEAAAAVMCLWLCKSMKEILGRKIEREQHLADLKQLEGLTLPIVSTAIREAQQFEVVLSSPSEA